jgi:hypothetical protein
VFCILMYQAFFNFSEAFYEYKHSHFDEGQWLESSEAIDCHLSHAGTRVWWRHPKRRALPGDFSDLESERLTRIEEKVSK